MAKAAKPYTVDMALVNLINCLLSQKPLTGNESIRESEREKERRGRHVRELKTKKKYVGEREREREPRSHVHLEVKNSGELLAPFKKANF